MKQISYTKIASLALGAVALGGTLASCDKEKLYTNDYPEAYPTTEITFRVSEVLPLGVGMDSTLVYTVGPEVATDKTVVFSSSDPSVATVDENGKITALKVGQTFVRAVPVIGFGANASVQVNVIEEVVKAEEVRVTALTEPSAEGYFYETDEIQLSCEILPADHTYDYVTWTSMDESIATVDGNGLVKCLKEGDAHIRCHTHDHSRVAGDYKVHIYKMQEVDHLDIKPLDGPLCITQGSVTLDVTYYPEGATVGSVTWETSDPTIVDVRRGVITPKGWGSATITATAPTGNTATITVTVDPGWYVWDAGNGWSDWETADNAAPDVRGDKVWHIEFANPTGKTGRNIRIKGISANGPFFTFMPTLYPVLAVRIDKPINKDAASKLDDATANGQTAKRTRELNPKDGIDLGDGTRLLVYNIGENYSPLTEEILFRIFQFKITDFTGLDVGRAYYDIYWIRTFRSEADALEFAKADVASGN